MKNILLTSLLVVTVCAASAAERARLANEKMILSGDTDAMKGSSIFDGQKGLLKVSPDGRKLLFYREEPEKLNGLNGVARLVLRDLTDGSETLLPFPALPARLVKYLPMLAFANNPFDKTGSKIVLGVGIDADKNGTFDARTEKMQAVVFDVATSETKNLAVTGTFVMPGTTPKETATSCRLTIRVNQQRYACSSPVRTLSDGRNTSCQDLLAPSRPTSTGSCS